ncbi:hypothetical protein C475_18863 [Halosimplex carlsbadense 2-9-1]|uniref:Uncharacterized protein n=1 Tax=Halosimplex carlsbadense 2-9-1 TaxID=797114 RepID=M0CGQ8_9EURY|nr:hypothetical protein C475_18863 [Halosimplex carlsbadense 2-9-1]
MAMTADGDWGLDVVYEAPDGLRPDMLLPESLPDIENAEGRCVSDKNRSSVFTSGALFGKVSLDVVLGIGDETRSLG